uniref:Uncharacterized protein n=1 Tax=Peronospora matthiolae TaxID=2874970 RepID=A0AAV1VD97_9STRA
MYNSVEAYVRQHSVGFAGIVNRLKDGEDIDRILFAKLAVLTYETEC